MEGTASEMDKGPRCPACGWMDVRRSMPHGLVDGLVRMIGLVPFRCRSCGHRFYRTQQDTPETSE
ncbi:MAG TPA: hypothetical protein VKR61_19775 [Bryobacteraceae bacterium]|nr:hypothetical protein [Bryobacteraceae bacterium]